MLLKLNILSVASACTFLNLTSYSETILGKIKNKSQFNVEKPYGTIKYQRSLRHFETQSQTFAFDDVKHLQWKAHIPNYLVVILVLINRI